MEILIKAGRLVFAIGIAGLGLQQFYFPGFRPVFIPAWPAWMPGAQPFVYLSSIGLIISGALIAFNFKPKTTSLILGCAFLALLIFFHIPFHVIQHTTSLGGWTNTFKILAFSGSSFVIAGSFSDDEREANAKPYLEKLISLGRIFFGIMMFVFGIDHFLYYQFVQTLVPNWIPFPLFWTYFAGIALVGAGVSFILKIKIKLIGILTAIMLFIWFLILHIPRAISMPEIDNGNEITSVFQALAFSGIALLIAFDSDT